MSNQLSENKDSGIGAELDDILPEDIDALIHSSVKRRLIKVRLPIAILILLLVSAGSFWGGAAAKNAETSSSSFPFSSLRSAFTGSGAASSFFSRFSATTVAPTASGEVVGVKGNTVYVTTSSGVLMKILMNKSTVVTRDANVGVGSLSIGDTVSVEGTKTAKNTVQATSVAATAQGVTTTTLP
ncbi:MAG: hypothetical protein M1374_00745 [Firmicutes bacterium]|nr:hypothetical protein [Bacillota bacterium]